MRDILKKLGTGNAEFCTLCCRNDTLLHLLLNDIESSIMQSSEASWLSTETGKHTRSKRQLGIALAFGGGYLAHSIFSSVSRKLFGTDDDVKAYVQKVNLLCLQLNYI